MNIQTVVDYKYCFTDVMIKWPGSAHYGRMFSTSALSNDIRNGSIPRCKRCIVAGEPAVPICLLGNPAYPLLPCFMKEFANGGKTSLKNYLVFACLGTDGNRVCIWLIRSLLWLLKGRNRYQCQRTTKSYKFMFRFKQFS